MPSEWPAKSDEQEKWMAIELRDYVLTTQLDDEDDLWFRRKSTFYKIGWGADNVIMDDNVILNIYFECIIFH